MAGGGEADATDLGPSRARLASYPPDIITIGLLGWEGEKEGEERR